MSGEPPNQHYYLATIFSDPKGSLVFSCSCDSLSYITSLLKNDEMTNEDMGISKFFLHFRILKNY
jgi:hypothetical protein